MPPRAGRRLALAAQRGLGAWVRQVHGRSEPLPTSTGWRRGRQAALRLGVGGGAAGGIVVALHVCEGSHGLPTMWPVAHAEAAAATVDRAKADVFSLAGDERGAQVHRGLLDRILNSLRLWVRFGFLSLLSTSVLIPGGALYMLPGWLPARGWLCEQAWGYALWCIELAGPTYVKLGQWAATRPDMFPEEFCHRFGRLHDDVAPHSWTCTVECLERRLGPGWEHQLVLEPAVIGSGCIAQVYRGTWYGTNTSRAPRAAKGAKAPAKPPRQDSGAKHGAGKGEGVQVAVKVCHPNIRSKVEADLQILKWACAQLEWWLPHTAYLGTLDVMADFEQLMHRQMDLRLEARNLLRFRENFAGERTVDVSFPEPLWYDSADVLVESFCEGAPIASFMAADAPYTAAHKQAIADMGVRISLMMVFQHNFIHADLHPGNILISYDPIADPTDTPSIVCLDAGLAYQVQRHTRMIQILGALMMRDGREAGRRMIAADPDDESRPEGFHSAEAVEAYCDGMQELVETGVNSRFFEHLGEYIYKFFKLAFEHKVKLDHNFVCCAMAIKVMEGLALQLHPSLDLITVAIPYVAACKVNEANTQLQQRARGLLGLPNRTTEGHTGDVPDSRLGGDSYSDWLSNNNSSSGNGT